MRYRFTEASFAAPVLMSTPGGYPPQQPGYQPPPPGYVPPPVGQPAGLTPNLAGVLCYLFGIIGGIVFLVLEPYKRDPFVRFHAFQSIFFSLAVIVIEIGWGIISGMLVMLLHGMAFIVFPLNALIGLAFFVVWVMLMVRAGQGQKWALPVLGPLAEKQALTGGL